MRIILKFDRGSNKKKDKYHLQNAKKSKIDLRYDTKKSLCVKKCLQISLQNSAKYQN